MDDHKTRDHRVRVDLWMSVIEALSLKMQISKREAAELIASEIRAAAQGGLPLDVGLLPEDSDELPEKIC